MHEGSYFAYIMASRSRTLYLQKRAFEHKWKEREGFTARYNCDRLVWFERFQDVRNAIAREKELKGWSRAKKIALIVSTNPGWMDLQGLVRRRTCRLPKSIGSHELLRSRCRFFTPLRSVLDDKLAVVRTTGANLSHFGGLSTARWWRNGD